MRERVQRCTLSCKYKVTQCSALLVPLFLYIYVHITQKINYYYYYYQINTLLLIPHSNKQTKLKETALHEANWLPCCSFGGLSFRNSLVIMFIVDCSCPRTICLWLVLASWGKGTANISLSIPSSACGFNGVEVTNVTCLETCLWTD